MKRELKNKRRLELNKESIQALTSSENEAAKGGMPAPFWTITVTTTFLPTMALRKCGPDQ